MPVFPDLCAYIHGKIVYGFSPLNHLLAYALRPLEPDLLAYLQKAQRCLSIPRIIQGTQETFEKFECILKVPIPVDEKFCDQRK